MASLWTPDGERPVGAEQSVEKPAPAEAVNGIENDPAVLEEMAKLEAELLELPVAEVIANHCYGIFQLAALHLAERPPRLEDARLAIDALGGIVESLGSRLGPVSATLAEGLAQLRLAFVEIAKSQNGPAPGPAENGETSPTRPTE